MNDYSILKLLFLAEGENCGIGVGLFERDNGLLSLLELCPFGDAGAADLLITTDLFNLPAPRLANLFTVLFGDAIFDPFKSLDFILDLAAIADCPTTAAVFSPI
jgi:hypothetical protein